MCRYFVELASIGSGVLVVYRWCLFFEPNAFYFSSSFYFNDVNVPHILNLLIFRLIIFVLYLWSFSMRKSGQRKRERDREGERYSFVIRPFHYFLLLSSSSIIWSWVLIRSCTLPLIWLLCVAFFSLRVVHINRWLCG